MKRAELINKISSPTRCGYDVIEQIVTYADDTMEVYNTLAILKSEVQRAIDILCTLPQEEILED
jgi:hypothetical protein